jgi:NodT family efflux transporter outer membrane factor (OMF) lipoprotein
MQTTNQFPRIPGRFGLWMIPAACLLGASGCAQIPSLSPPAAVRSIDQLGSSRSLTAQAAPWPKDEWWQAYGDPQLNSLIGEALRDSPNLAVALARLRQAGAMSQEAGAPLMPEVTGNAAFTKDKQSYNYLIPRSALPQGWNAYGQATLNLSWELDFWGKNHAALAAATSEEQAVRAEVAQTRLILSASVASAYVELLHLYTVRDSAEEALNIRTKTVDMFRQRHEFGLENLASVRQVEARQAAAQAALLVIDERIALQRNAIAALLGAGPDRGLAITRPTAHFAGTLGLPPNLALELVGRRPDIVAARLRTEVAAKRIDQQKAGFYPSVNLAGGLHDIGKIAVPTEILAKPGKLNHAEFALIKFHPSVGYDALKDVDFPWPVAQVALQHHERMDGNGYPQGLKGEEILFEARILAVADVVESMASHRPYRPALGIERALAEIERGRGMLYDPQVSDACLRLFREMGYQIFG